MHQDMWISGPAPSAHIKETLPGTVGSGPIEIETGMIEVELKFPVASLVDVRDQLVELGATSETTTMQSDEYVNDPLRDFGKMDLALRIRNCDGKYWLTFKGPNLDETAKIRREIEMPLVDSDAAQQMSDVFSGIGFVSVAKVEKRREVMELSWQDVRVTVCLDGVEEVGEFVELELVVEKPQQVPGAKQRLQELAKTLSLTGATRTSYLEMLLKNRGMI